MEKNSTPEKSVKPTNPIQNDVLLEMQKLRAELATLNAQNIFGIHRIALRTLFMQFLRGTAFGLGGIVGVTVVLSILAYFLSKIDFLPVIGDWAKAIAAEIRK
ncbi:MAG TPA: DUF5665 domain-containing protein [Pseudomonadales bacterium]|nr:DUF5665 domain-containing protein [Pseudomonadales bacterium]